MSNVKLSTLEKFCEFFDVSLDYLMCDDITNPDYGIKPSQVSYTLLDEIMEEEKQLFGDDDRRFVNAYVSLPKETREWLRKSIFALADAYNQEEGANNGVC